MYAPSRLAPSTPPDEAFAPFRRLEERERWTALECFHSIVPLPARLFVLLVLTVEIRILPSVPCRPSFVSSSGPGFSLDLSELSPSDLTRIPGVKGLRDPSSFSPATAPPEGSPTVAKHMSYLDIV